jgi:hypothetical protein
MIRRLDVGCSDFALKRQLRAMQSLHLDPISQDMAGFPPAVRKSLPPVTTDSMNEVDEALDTVLKWSRAKNLKEEFILQGTTLRDKLLRAFQEDFVPYDPTADSINGASFPSSAPGAVEVEASARVHDVVQETNQLRPTDVDATPIPTEHIDGGPQGVLARNQLIQSWTRRYRTEDGREPVIVEGDPMVPLNPSQMRAIAMMLSERLSLVQGVSAGGIHFQQMGNLLM